MEEKKIRKSSWVNKW